MGSPLVRDAIPERFLYNPLHTWGGYLMERRVKTIVLHALEQFPQVQIVYLFGSAARATVHCARPYRARIGREDWLCWYKPC